MEKSGMILPHLLEDEIRERVDKSRNLRIKQQWLIVLDALQSPSSSYRQIAARNGISHTTVSRIISRYNDRGPDSLERQNRIAPHRPNALLTKEEEREFLQPFFERVRNGKIPKASEIQAALKRKLGKPVHTATVYRLLNRNSWKQNY